MNTFNFIKIIIKYLIKFLIYIEKLIIENPKQKSIINLPIIKRINLIIKPNPIVVPIVPIKLIKIIKQYIEFMKNKIRPKPEPKPVPVPPVPVINGLYILSMRKDENNKYILSNSTIEYFKIWDKNDNEIKFKKINPNSIVKQLLSDYSTRENNLKSFSIQNAFKLISLIVEDNEFKIDLGIKLSNGNYEYYKNF
jgi:hypothetical protein